MLDSFRVEEEQTLYLPVTISSQGLKRGEGLDAVFSDIPAVVKDVSRSNMRSWTGCSNLIFVWACSIMNAEANGGSIGMMGTI